MAEAPKEGQTFESFVEFETFLHQYCSTTAQTFVVDDSRKIETVNAKLSDEKKLPDTLKYGFVKYTCVKFGSKHTKKIWPVTGARPNQRYDDVHSIVLNSA